MGQWSREELEEAFHNYEQAVVRISETWDWSSYADQFTEDACNIRRARTRQLQRSRADPGMDLVDDEQLPGQRDAVLPLRVVLH